MEQFTLWQRRLIKSGLCNTANAVLSLLDPSALHSLKGQHCQSSLLLVTSLNLRVRIPQSWTWHERFAQMCYIFMLDLKTLLFNDQKHKPWYSRVQSGKRQLRVQASSCLEITVPVHEMQRHKYTTTTNMNMLHQKCSQRQMACFNSTT